MNESGTERVLRIITKSLGLKEQINEGETVETVQEWDSLGHLTMLTALDKEFKGRLVGVQDLASAGSVKKILDILEREKLI
jgi:acyl carrier protein